MPSAIILGSHGSGARLSASKRGRGPEGKLGHLSYPGVAFKGSREGLRLILPAEGDFGEVYAELEGKLADSGGFFRGATVALEPRRRLLPEETAALRALLKEHGLEVVANKGAKAVSSPSAEAMVAVRAPIRSGQCVETEGTLLVLGDLHPGAEIRAGRDVIVMGSARGEIAAGLASGRAAQVFAFLLRPSLLRLGDLVARSPGAGSSLGPEIARVRDGRIVVEPFTGWPRAKARGKA